MKKKNLRCLFAAACLLAAFALWTALVRTVDVQAIGPQGTVVGFAALNRFVHELTGVHMPLYTVTDWLGLVPVCLALGFALLGLRQWIQRKRLCSVDRSILALGGFYIAVIAAYVLFEAFAVNYRPVLIEGRLEASYPSSTTLLVMCVMPTTAMQFNTRIRNKTFRHSVSFIVAAFIAFMVIGRLVSGVHWFTDIVGGILLSTGLVMMYYSLSGLK